jgi:hypothetical protein
MSVLRVINSDIQRSLKRGRFAPKHCGRWLPRTCLAHPERPDERRNAPAWWCSCPGQAPGRDTAANARRREHGSGALPHQPTPPSVLTPGQNSSPARDPMRARECLRQDTRASRLRWHPLVLAGPRGRTPTPICCTPSKGHWAAEYAGSRSLRSSAVIVGALMGPHSVRRS